MYVDFFHCKSFLENPTIRIRILECILDECKFSGKSTRLISIEALESKLKKARGQTLSNLDSLSLEHPIPYRVIATSCLDRETPLTLDEFVKLWRDNLVTTIVTRKQNWALIKFQSMFKLGDCWKKMYKTAGVKLVQDPDLRNNDIRKQYDFQPINRGRKKNAKQ